MKIGPLGITEIIIILVVVLIIFGPKNLPKLGTAIGKAVKNLKEGLGGHKKVKEANDKDDGEVVEVIDKPKPGSAATAATEEASTSQPAQPQAAEATVVEEPVSAKPKPKAIVEDE